MRGNFALNPTGKKWFLEVTEQSSIGLGDVADSLSLSAGISQQGRASETNFLGKTKSDIHIRDIMILKYILKFFKTVSFLRITVSPSPKLKFGLASDR